MRERKTNKWLRAALLAVLVFVLGAGAVSAAPLDEQTKAGLAEEVGNFVSQAYQMDDAMLDQYRAGGGFYEVMVDAIRDNADDLGALKEVKSTTIDDSGEEIIATVNAAFEKYDADITIYMDPASYEPKNFVVDPDFPFAKKMAQAGENTVIGLVIVFAVLFFLMFVISMFRFIDPESRRKKKAPEAGLIVPDVIEPAGAPVAAAAPAGNDAEIAAVIAAAIAAAEEAAPSASGYVVRSMKRRTTNRNKMRG